MVILTPISSTFSIDTSSTNLVCSHVLISRIAGTTENRAECDNREDQWKTSKVLHSSPRPTKQANAVQASTIKKATTGYNRSKRAPLSYKISQSEIYLYSEHFTFSTITFDPEVLRRRRQHLSYTPRPPCSDSIKEEVQRSYIGWDIAIWSWLDLRIEIYLILIHLNFVRRKIKVSSPVPSNVQPTS